MPMERNETLQLMEQLETLVLKKGWPVPFSNYYLVHHEQLLSLLDQLRASLQDEMDARFIRAFGRPGSEDAPLRQTQKKTYISASSGKER